MKGVAAALAVIAALALALSCAANAEASTASMREQLKSLSTMAALDDAPPELREQLSSIHRQLRQLNAASPDTPAMVRVSHSAAEVRLGEGDDFVSFARADNIADGMGDVAPSLHVRDSVIIDKNVTIGGALYLNGRTIIEGVDLWVFIKDLLAENDVQDATIGALTTRVDDLDRLTKALNASLASVVAGGVGQLGVGSTASNPAKSCLDAKLRGGALTSGTYHITFYGTQAASQPVFCDMEFKGGGWTLLTSQDDDHYFSKVAGEATYWHATNVNSPSPTSELYSILGKVDKLRGPNGDWAAQYWYEDDTDRTRWGKDQWVRTQQSNSVLLAHDGNYVGDFTIIDYGDKAPLTQYLTGFGQSKTPDCAVDGNVHNWIFCCAQFKYYSTNCGLVSGYYDGRNYCDSAKHSFWVREIAA